MTLATLAPTRRLLATPRSNVIRDTPETARADSAESQHLEGTGLPAAKRRLVGRRSSPTAYSLGVRVGRYMAPQSARQAIVPESGRERFALLSGGKTFRGRGFRGACRTGVERGTPARTDHELPRDVTVVSVGDTPTRRLRSP